MKCCGHCFGDRCLSDTIEWKSVGERAMCSYCGTEDVHVVAPGDIAFLFDAVTGVYEKSRVRQSRTLASLLKKDWGLFPKMKLAEANHLLAAILDDQNIENEQFAPLRCDDDPTMAEWSALREELIGENRYFLNHMPETQQARLAELLGLVEAKGSEVAGQLFRARLQKTEEPYVLSKMGRPPPDKAIGGRANPVGIPYLYTASSIETAISEIRPHKGEWVSIATFALGPETLLADLRNPRATISPFREADWDVKEALRGLSLLCHLSEELAEAVVPRRAHLEYLPNQYLCEFIKKQDFHGVVYRSSVGRGFNVALFGEDRVTASSVERHRVTGVTCKTTAA